MFIKTSLFMDVVTGFDYYTLIDSTDLSILNINYWKAFTRNYKLTDLALIVSPGIGQGVDFDGSGLYKIVS